MQYKLELLHEGLGSASKGGFICYLQKATFLVKPEEKEKKYDDNLAISESVFLRSPVTYHCLLSISWVFSQEAHALLSCEF